ncbi:hypothetical protein O181_076452 [Austropuccinia psidii MF-1]|uniref:Integrase catalytic domain-containing protein n=1 Tax=Austropuccinia psidii MF-1 TaxID=1389203 RepID=A0A9Q3FEC0_9BASI|nr:hypothetical protein [Austropuccinia psidii MF-1]
MLFLLKASRWTKQKSSRLSTGLLQETSRLFNNSLALPTSTVVSSRIIQRRSVHSPFFSRKISVSPSMRKLSVSFTNSKRFSPLLQSFSTHHWKHPIAFDSRKLIPAELNYEIHDKEPLGILWDLKRWRAFLLSLSSPFEVITNHSSLQYFMSSNVLTHHQACWAEFLSEFNFSITYFPGRLATLPDSLSHWDDICWERGEDFISKNPMNFQQLIKQDEVQPSRYFAVKVESFSNLIESIQKKLWQDPQYRSILQELGQGKSVQDYSLDFSSQLLLFKHFLVVPNEPTIQLRILQKRHDSPLAGHPGQEKTLKLVNMDFHWSGMTQFINYYVSSCQQCSRNNNINHKKFGLLKPLPIPNGPWICLSMDFITKLPLSNSFDSILVMLDRFSKMAVFIPTRSSITSLDLAHLLINNIFLKHGLLSSIVSDRSPLSVSSLWTNLRQQLKISRDLSTAYNQETDGQTERVNQMLKQYLWMFVIYHQDYSNTWLPLAEFSCNNFDHSSTKQLPFFTVYGRDPKFYSAHITQDNPSGKGSTKVQSVQQNVNREIEAAINQFKRYADKSRASPPDFTPGDMVWISPKNTKSTRTTKKLSERWLGPFPILKKVSTHAYHLNRNPSTQSSIFPSWNQSRHQQSQIGIKSLLLQSSSKKKRNGKSLKYWIQSSREESYVIWCNGRVSVNTQKDPLGNQLKA